MTQDLRKLTLSDYIGDEIFILCGNEDDQAGTEMSVFMEMVDLQNQLATMSPIIDKDARVIHGVLTKADYLPANLRGKTAFLIVVSKDDPDKGLVQDSAAMDVSELALDIESVVKGGPIGMPFDGIDDMYVLYGYELEVGLTVDPYEVDDQAIDDCVAIYSEVNEVALEFSEHSAKSEVTTIQGGAL